MSKVYVFITNGPAGSGKDAISLNIQEKIVEKTKNEHIKDEVHSASFKNILFKYTSEIFKDYELNNFYDSGDNGEYGREKKELPNSKLSLKNITSEYLTKFYIETNNKLNTNIDYSEHIKNFNKQLNEFKNKYKVTGEELSPRLALIFTSEYIIKPIYGEDFFGTVIAKELENLYKDNINNKNNINVFITDSGFPAELKGINELSKLNKDIKPVILSIYRPGIDYDPSKDSRARLTNESLKKVGIDFFPMIRVNNDRTLEECGKTTFSKINDYKSLGVIIPDRNVANLTFVDKSNKSNLEKVGYILELLNQDNPHNQNSYVINNINVIDDNITIQLVNKNGETFNNSDIKSLNKLLDIYSSGGGNNYIKRNLSYIFDENLKVNKEFTESMNLKNLTENLKAINNSKIPELKPIKKAIENFLNLSPKNNEVYFVLNELLLRNTNLLLNNIDKIHNIKLYEQNIKSLNTLAINTKDKMKDIDSSGVYNKTDQLSIKLNTNLISDVYNIFDKIRNNLPIDLDKLIKEKNIFCVKGKEGYEIRIQNIPKSKLDFLIKEKVEITNNLDKNIEKPIYSSQKINDNFNTVIESINNIQNSSMKLISSNLLNSIKSFIKEPTIENYIDVKYSNDKFKEHLSFFGENKETKKLEDIINSISNINLFPNISFNKKDIKKNNDINKDNSLSTPDFS